MATLLKTWSTYYLYSGTGTASATSSHSDAKGQVKVYLESQNYANNTSYIRIDHYAILVNIGMTPARWCDTTPDSSYRCNVGSYGGTYQSKSKYLKHTASGSGTYLLGSTYHTVTHEADGTAVLYFNGSVDFYLNTWTPINSPWTLLDSKSGTKSSSSTVDLPTIPRYATITAFNIDNITSSSFHFNVSADVSIDYVQHSLNGGAWTDSGSQTISGLSAGTQYSLKCRVRRTDSGLWTESGTIYATTLSPATITTFNWYRNSDATGLSKLWIQWGTNVSCDAVEYSINGGGWTSTGQSGTGTYYGIGGLSPNTQYSMRIRVKRADNQLWTESGTSYATTYDIAKITATPNNNINIENNASITYTNPSGGATQISLYKTDGMTPIASYRSCTGTNYEFVFTSGEKNTFYSQTPNSKTLTLRFYISTSDSLGGYWLHYVERTFEVFDANPIFTTWTYEDINATATALTGNNQNIIKNYSNVNAIVTAENKATAQKSATMSYYLLTIGGKTKQVNWSSTETVNLLINNADNSTFTLDAVDSRGNATRITKSVTMINYVTPIILAGTATRTDDIEKETTLAYNGQFFNSSFGSVTNTVKTAIYEYKVTTDSSYTTGSTSILPTASDNTFSLSKLIAGDDGANGFLQTNSYNIRITITDELSSAVFNLILGTGRPNLAIHKDGVAINGAYDETLGGALQVNGSLQIPSTADVSLSSTDNPIQIGPTAGTNVVFDCNEIIARNNGAVSSLYLNNDGGNVYVNGKNIKNNLILDYTAPTDTNNLVFNTLDLVSDGNIYDVEIIVGGSIGITSLYLKANSFTQGYWYSVIRSWGSATFSGAINTQSYFWANSSYFQCGEVSNASFTQIIMTISKAPDGIKFVSSNNYVASGFQYMGTYSCNLYSTTDNLTSLSFWVNDGIIKAGSRIRIWRRDT